MGRPLRHAILLAAALAPAILSAQTAKTWTSATGEFADFATGANWSGGVAPTNNTTTHYAQFTSGFYGNNQAYIAASRSIAGLEWTSTAYGGGFSYLSGTPVLTLGAYGLRTAATDTVDIDVALALGTSTSFQDNGYGFRITGPLALGANTLTLGGTSTSFSYSRLLGLISGTGGLTLNYTGNSGWLLGSDNTYTGTTTLTAGNIITGNNGFGTGTLVFNGGTLLANGNTSYGNSVLSIAGTANFNPGTYALTFSGGATLTGSRTIDVAGTGAVVLDGALGQSSAGYGLTKSGTGALVLNAASTYTGATTVTGGTLALGASGTISNANLVLNGGTLSTQGTWSRAYGSGANQFQFGSSGGGFAAYGGALNVTVANGADNWYEFFGNSQYARFGSTISDNVVTFTNDLALWTSLDYFIEVIDNPNSTADLTVFSGVLSDTALLVKQGNGTLVLTGANTRTGGTSILGGTLRAAHATALGTGGVTLQSATLQLAQDAATDFGNNVQVASAGGTVVSDRLTAGAGLKHQLGTLSLSNSFTVQKGANVTSGTGIVAFDSASGGGTINVNAGAKLELGAFSGSANLAFNGAGDTEILGAFTTGSGVLTKSGLGVLTLNTASTRTGLTSLSAGTIVLNADGALGTGAFNLTGSATIAGSGDLTIANTFTSNGLHTLTVANPGKTTFSGNVALSTNATNQILTINNSGEVLLSGIIANGSTSTSGLVKTGTGLLTLGGANTFTGATTVNAGTFNLTGSLQSPTLIVADGASLTGAGTLKSLSLAGIYSPGNSPALVSLDNLTMVSTAVLNLEIGGTTRGTQYDALAIANALTAAGTLNVSFVNGFVPSGTTTFDLFDFSSSSGSFATINVTGLDWHWTWDTTSLLTTGELTLNFTAVPEPSTYALLATGLGLAALARRRKAR